jgi:hypothetical protein
MANERDREEMNRDPDDIRGADDDQEFDEGDEGDLEGEDEDEFEDEDLTGEIGSEGGSPGENVRTREPRRPARGSEATETVQKRR